MNYLYQPVILGDVVYWDEIPNEEFTIIEIDNDEGKVTMKWEHRNTLIITDMTPSIKVKKYRKQS